MSAKVNLENYTTGNYKAGKNLFTQILWFVINVVFFKNSLNPFNGVKVFLLRLFGAEIGKGVVIKPSVNIKYPWKLKIGNHSWIGESAWIDNLDFVEIGESSVLSQGAMILSGNHNYKKTSFDLITKPIFIGDGVWIGAKSVVTGGVSCENHSVLSVFSVASKDLQSNKIYKGNPAVDIGDRIID